MNDAISDFLDWLEIKVEQIVTQPHPQQAFIEFTNSYEFTAKAQKADGFWMQSRYNTIVAKHANKLV